MLWSHDETNLLKEFLHVSRLGGQFDGSVEEATWEKVVNNMNIVGTTRDIALRTYKVRDVAWQYISMIWPLLNTESPYVASGSNPWTLDEDDLLLHYLPSRYPGGRFEDTTGEVKFANVASSMNAIGPMFGFNWRVYKGVNIANHYKWAIYPRFTGRTYKNMTCQWQADETKSLLSFVSVHQGGYLEGDEVPLGDLAVKMSDEAKIRGWSYREYTSEILRCRLRRARKERSSTGQLSGPFIITSSTDPSAVAGDSSDVEDFVLSDDEMDTKEG
jgi:hypothetical protein